MIRRSLSCTGIVFVMLCTMAVDCGNSPSESGGTQPPEPVQVADFCLSDSDLSGWIAWANPCNALADTDLVSTKTVTGGINGGGTMYTEEGMQEYVYQELSNDSKGLVAYVMEYSDTAGAQSIYATKKLEVSTSMALTGYGESSVIVSVIAGGVVHEVYACFGKYFFLLTFSGLADESEAQSLIGLVLSTYQGRMN